MKTPAPTSRKGKGKTATRSRERLFIINDPRAPRLCPELASEIGLNESILLLQLEYLIGISTHLIDGRRWTYQSVTDLQGMFPFWGRATIQRTIESLESQQLIIVANHNKMKYDRTRWFALNPEGVNGLKSIRLAEPGEPFQNGTAVDNSSPPAEAVPNRNKAFQSGTGSFQDGTTIPEITPESTSEITQDPSKLRKAEPQLTIVDKPVDKASGPPRPKGDAPATEFWSDAIAQYAIELSRTILHDELHVQSNISNAMHRWRDSGLAVDAFIERMEEAKVRTLKHTATIRTAPNLAARGCAFGQKNRAPYFFAVLKDLISGGGAERGQDPLREEEASDDRADARAV